MALCNAVRNCTNINAETAFWNSCGTNVDGLIGHLSFYLDHTCVSFDGEVYVQKGVTGSRSRVAPVLCDIYSADCENAPLEVGGRGLKGSSRSLDTSMMALPLFYHPMNSQTQRRPICRRLHRLLSCIQIYS